jgi:hypothetical protein
MEIALGMLELDYALENDKPEAPAAGVDGFDELMETYKKNSTTWERSNRMSLKIMKGPLLRESWEQSPIQLMLRNTWTPLKKNIGAMTSSIASPSCISSSTLSITSPKVLVNILFICVILVQSSTHLRWDLMILLWSILHLSHCLISMGTLFPHTIT